MYTPGLWRSPQPEPQLKMPRRVNWSSAVSSSHTRGPLESPWVGDTRLSALGLGSALDRVGRGHQAGPRAHLARVRRKPARSMPGGGGGSVHVGGGAALRTDEWHLSAASSFYCRKLEYSPDPANRERLSHTPPDSSPPRPWTWLRQALSNPLISCLPRSKPERE